jgi:hypothetical protein
MYVYRTYSSNWNHVSFSYKPQYSGQMPSFIPWDDPVV